MQDVTPLVMRAANWFAGRLPPAEQTPSFQAHVLGPKFDADDPDAIVFHTFACTFPHRGIYVALSMVTDNVPAHWRVTGPRIRDVITEYTPTPDQVTRQRESVGPTLSGLTSNQRWELALGIASLFDVPLAMMAFGHHRPSDTLVVYQQSVQLAPLVRVAKHFKEKAPRINLN